MSALRAVPEPEQNTSNPVLDLAPDAADPGADPGAGLDPRTDPESLTLCALMWSVDTAAAARVTDALVPADFAEPAYAELFTVIADLVTSGRPHDPASVAAVLHRAGGGQKDAPLRRALADVVTADTTGSSAAVHYADIVLSQSYRRSFHITGQRLMQAAEQGPEDELFDYMVELGTAQRAAWKRLNTFRAGGAHA
ncbi:DNA helicase [Rhodococcus sp. BP-149]|uniref:DnaB-like helicase N-terminal domain-containing protein n=1 Tax=unclassified Rhodococcus (in: high G+C Gram-positive bacteria) TaxID=192944 RepID=UPI001C9A520F|nr:MULTISPECIES: DnaB-like helicase N-terminal domain-containing protein [unclassified Rhodococcus (in: high G+C Gram-positive bacteria)]MBY6687482.1 DNA helicase [Rhodococcus sp. BP-288]MBY6696423.1 DNA helicase [Rhodococcus sp. BP-188]MBY6700555.1 DNA helicase [Rhodococcus sp. BP-285]MBY6704422.1 DNA helicase [Rhodococcus sp. BP-283]MBY6713680.1 DNA helicase [Rhodococcus sp. BP-160]